MDRVLKDEEEQGALDCGTHADNYRKHCMRDMCQNNKPTIIVGGFWCNVIEDFGGYTYNVLNSVGICEIHICPAYLAAPFPEVPFPQPRYDTDMILMHELAHCCNFSEEQAEAIGKLFLPDGGKTIEVGK